MDFTLSEEQNMLREAAARFVREQYGLEARRKLLAGDGWSREHWRAYGEFGWLGLLVPEQHGGLGCSVIEAAILFEELGHAIVLEPLLASAVVATRLIDRSGNQRARASRLPRLAAGEAILALACEETQQRQTGGGMPHTVAERTRDGWQLRGTKTLALGGGHATELVVSARIQDDGRQRLGLFLVDPGSPGLRLDAYALVDGRGAADVWLDGVTVAEDALLASGEAAEHALDDALDIGRLVAMAEALGGMEACLAITSDYIKTRVQFKQPIGKFQALQHLMADMFVDAQESRSIVYRALASVDAAAPQRRRAIAAARVVTGESGRRVSASGVQMHGGYGQTDEYRISHHFRQMLVLDKLFGDAQESLAVLAGTPAD